MFTKKDYIKYFQEIKKIETHMIEDVAELEKMVRNKDIKNRLHTIKQDEIKHEKIVEAILEIIA